MDDYNDETLFVFLDNNGKLLERLGLHDSTKLLNNIKQDIRNSIGGSVDKNKLCENFKDLQQKMHEEFSTSEHRGKIIAQLLDDYRKVMKYNLQEAVKIINLNSKVDENEKRMNSYKNLLTLKKIAINGSENVEERTIGISYAYLSLVEGIYEGSMIDAHMWNLLAQNQSIDFKAVKKLSLSDIKNQFKSKNKDMSCFEGYDKTVRNAVGHSSMKFDETKNKMTYQDDKGNVSEYNFEEMIENYDKLEVMYYAIMMIGALIGISQVLDIFCNRYK